LRRIGAAAGVAACTTIVLTAQPSSSERQAVAGYVAAIMNAESGRGARPVETAFAAVTPLREALMRVREDHGHETVLESLPDDDFARLERDLRGVWINREESVYVKPDVDYFVNLASTVGDQVDKEFFTALKMTYQDSHEPAFLELVTDVTACTVFGKMDLVKIYGAWSAFRSRYPDRYKDGAQAEWNDVQFQLTEGTCACDDAASVERELDEFVRTFPTSPDRTAVERRLHDVQAGHSDIRFNCRPG
jgi:hypothetical protein